MRFVSVEKANFQCLQLIKAALQGEEIIITQDGKPIIKFIPVDPTKEVLKINYIKHTKPII